jgi:hypothetical protein
VKLSTVAIRTEWLLQAPGEFTDMLGADLTTTANDSRPLADPALDKIRVGFWT